MTGEEPTSPGIPMRQQPMTLQQAVAGMVVTALLGALGGAGGGITFGGQATAADVALVRAELGSLDEKLDTIMAIIEEKHPRK